MTESSVCEEIFGKDYVANKFHGIDPTAGHGDWCGLLLATRPAFDVIGMKKQLPFGLGKEEFQERRRLGMPNNGSNPGKIPLKFDVPPWCRSREQRLICPKNNVKIEHILLTPDSHEIARCLSCCCFPLDRFAASPAENTGQLFSLCSPRNAPTVGGTAHRTTPANSGVAGTLSNARKDRPQTNRPPSD